MIIIKLLIQQYITLIMLLLFLSIGVFAKSTIDTKDLDIASSIKLLSDKKESDDAYLKIINIGVKAIPYLIENSNNQDIFEGILIYNTSSSLLVDKPTVGLVSLYLIECIIMESETPYLAPLIVQRNEKVKINNSPKTNLETIKKAASFYKKWWFNTKNLESNKKIKLSPLKGSEFKWWGDE